MASLGDLSSAEFAALADSQAGIAPFPPPPIAMAFRVSAGVPLRTVAAYCDCSVKSLERAERGIFSHPRSIDKGRYAKALGVCELWLEEHKPGTSGDIYNLWRDLLDQARNGRVSVNT